MPDKTDTNTVSTRDRDVLRRLAQRVLEIADDPINIERRQAWTAHHDLRGVRPMILAEAGEVAALIGLNARSQTRDSRLAAQLEQQLLMQIWRFEELRDDGVVEPFVNCTWQVTTSNFGVKISAQHGEASSSHGRGSAKWNPPLKNLDDDFNKLHIRTNTVDREATLRRKEHIETIFEGLLPVRFRHNYWWTTGMTMWAIHLLGLEEFMLTMYDNPDGLHRLMAFLRDDQLNQARWLEAEGLLTLNNENDYIGSGSVGYVSDLPADDHTPGQPARMKDMWVLSESQETVSVSPEMFAEFVLPYQKDIVKEFGLCYYGCCEPLHQRWHLIKEIPNLRCVSISPWCDQEFMAEALGENYVFCRKPNPTLISTEKFDEDAIRADLQQTMDATGGRNLEIVMKDIHTIRGEKQRPARWVELARQVCAPR